MSDRFLFAVNTIIKLQ